MIIKNMTRRTATFRQLLTYMVHGIDPMDDMQASISPYNMSGRKTIENWVAAFISNETNRHYHRNDSVKLHHTVISFSNKDYASITQAMLRDITKKYLQLRSEYSLTVAVLHSSESHYHIHICQSGVELYTGKSTRISKERFQAIKKELQQYQIDKYPMLQHSVVDHDKRSKQRISEKEYQLKKRTGKPSEKDQTKELLSKLFKESQSKEEFYKRITAEGLQTYTRNNKVVGVVGKRKMRFTKLGFTIEQLEQREELMHEFEKLRNHPNHRRDINELDR
jgi:hypothetical protein